MERAYLSTYENRTYSDSPTRSRYAVSWTSLFIKRSFDIILAVISSLLLSPLIATISLLIAIRDGRPVVFAQKRVGRNGKEFTLYKFRTMRIDAESDGRARLCADGDSRLTPLGKFLRRHHLDELPQLWNVLRGDMSFVGHRPERKVFINEISGLNPDYSKLYVLRPGLFSYATLYNGYTDTMEKMLRRLKMDLDYLHRRNLLMDCKIIFLTAFFIISGKKF